MTISTRVHQEFYHHHGKNQRQLIRIPPGRQANFTPCGSFPQESTTSTWTCGTSPPSPPASRTWTVAEHDRFLRALELFTKGPWKEIAGYVGNKTARQAMSHAQKYRQKIARRRRGLQVSKDGNTKTTRQVPALRPSSPIRVDRFPAININAMDAMTPWAMAGATATATYAPTWLPHPHQVAINQCADLALQSPMSPLCLHMA